jgi:hypothetical protein
MKKEALFFTDKAEIGTERVPLKSKRYVKGGKIKKEYPIVELQLYADNTQYNKKRFSQKAYFDFENDNIKFVGLDTFGEDYRMKWIKVQEKTKGYCIKSAYFGGVVYIENYFQLWNEYNKKTNPKMANGGLIAPNGNPSNLTPEQYKMVRTPEFKAWFGDWENDPENASKVVDENGEPLVVYHGSIVDFNLFENKPREVGRRITSVKGFYFTKNKWSATQYAGSDGFVKSYFLKILAYPSKQDKKVLEYSNIDDYLFDYGKSIDRFGYDGAIDVQGDFIVFESNQIKLADGTNTTFDSNNPDIRFKNGGKIENLISKGDIDLKFYETTPEHAKEFSIKANNPIYIQNLNIAVNKRLQGIGKEVLENIETQARKNGNDVIFGYVAQKATFTKDKTISYFSDVEMIKNWLHSKGYAINDQDNIFHKVLNPSLTPNNEDIRFETGGNVLLAPNGQPSKLTPEQYKLVRTPEFKAWFGDWENDPENASKVVDSNEEPLVCYHGTDVEFNEFDKNKIASNNPTDKAKLGFWFTSDLWEAEGFAYGFDESMRNENGRVITSFLNIREPLDIESNTVQKKLDKKYSKDRDIAGMYIEGNQIQIKQVLNKKNDGIVLSPIFIVFESNQIKLADGTNTTFDSNNSDIRFKEGGKIKGVTEVVYQDNGDTILIGSKNLKTRVSVKGLSLEQIKEELEFEKDMLRFKKSGVVKFSEDEIRSQRGMTDKEKLDAIKMHKQSLVEIEKVEKIIIPFYESKINSFEDGGSIDSERIDCQKCDWSWKVADGGDDLYVCHKCGYDNEPYYATKFAGGGGIDINEPFNVNGKTLAERVRILVKQLYPDYKWSVTSSYTKMDVYLLQADFDPFTEKWKEEHPEGRLQYNVDDRDLRITNSDSRNISDRAVEVFKPIREYIDKYVENYNAGDPYADYSNYNVYEYTNIGKWDKPYVQVEPKAGKKAKAKPTITSTAASTTPTTTTPKMDYPFQVGDILAHSSEELNSYTLNRAFSASQEWYIIKEINEARTTLLKYSFQNNQLTIIYQTENIIKEYVKATAPLFKFGDTVVNKSSQNNPQKIKHRSYYQQIGVKYSTPEKRFLLSGMYWNYELEDGTYANENELEFYNAPKTTATQEKGLPSTDPQTWNGSFKVGDKVKIRWDFSNDLGLPATKGNAKVDYFSNDNNFTIVRIDKRFQEPEATGGIQRPENPTGLLYVLSNKQSWEGKDLELVDGTTNTPSATPTTQPQYNFLDYLTANSESANKYGKDLEIASSFAAFVNAANQIENMPKKEYAELMGELLDKFPKTTN